jgi:RimJ/RimL family protein N-acetyltransferase
MADAKAYITSNPATSYRKQKYGLKAVILKRSRLPIGLCGLIKRDYLPHPDLGFAFIPEYAGQGFGYESSRAVLDRPSAQKPIYAMTGLANLASQGLLKKLGFKLEGTYLMPPDQFECLMFKLNNYINS